MEFVSGRFGRGQKLEKGVLLRWRRREKFLSTFLEIFGKFVDKNAIKSDFWGGHGRNISKISKKYPVWEKNKEILLPKCRDPPPQQKKNPKNLQ